MKQSLAIMAGLSLAAAGKTLQVGDGNEFSRIEQAVEAAQPGDTIEVHPLPGGQAYEKVALLLRKPRVALRGAAAGGARVAIDGTGFDYSGRGPVPRAIVQFHPGSDGSSIEGFALRGAHNGSHNGAGVRINQANSITVRNCEIHGNDMGIMSNGDGTDRTARGQLIEHCLIHSNGDPADPGYNHNLYLGGTEVTVRGCEIHSSLTGHNLKSRAHRLAVLACHIHGSANRELDLVDAAGDTDRPGSDAILAGNVIAKSPACRGNRAVIHFGQDGGKGRQGTLVLLHNTIVSPFVSPVIDLSTPDARAFLLNNIIDSGGAQQAGQVLAAVRPARGPADRVTGRGNWLAAGFRDQAEAWPLQDSRHGQPGTRPPFADPAAGNFRLTAPDPACVDTASPCPPQLIEETGGRLLEFRPGPAAVPRPAHGPPDRGAFEFAGG